VDRILGIDPGSRVMGYAVLTSDGARAPRLAYVECGVVTADPTSPLELRLGEIARNLAEIISELKPTVAAVEDVFSSVNARSALALGQARGVVLAACGLVGLRVYAYPPSKVKQAVTGRGGATKLQVAQMVRQLVGLHTVPRADAADALAVAVAHAHVAARETALLMGRAS
jgi:crossover junction endodeoxyribonuclease RuvC